ncbi:MAG: DUF1987 domain-containing protein [Bacteroidetes bacterium]|nr:MAG: DUF1987 domain-containing protein [Bacteroidota bacterium]
MEALFIKGDEKTPFFKFDPNGTLEIYGRSWPEDVLEAYQPALDWYAEYKKNPAPTTKVIFKIEYFNTSSSKIIYDLLADLDEFKKQGYNVEVEWYYEEDDPDMLDVGETYQDIFPDLGIKTIPVEEFEYTVV